MFDRELLKTLSDDPTFAVGDLLRKLDAQPHTVESAGQRVDAARRLKGQALSQLSSAKQTLQMAEAVAAMNMPPDASNEVKRKSYITTATQAEQQMVLQADTAVIQADSAVADAARDHQLQMDILISLQKKADIITAALRFLAPR